MKLDISQSKTANGKNWRHSRIEWDEFLRWVENPGSQKESGGYVFGRFTGPLRRNATLISRSAITIDADKAGSRFLDDVGALGWMAVAHSTFNSAPDQRKYRVVIPADREMTGAEYEVAATVVMYLIGAHQCDPVSRVPAQFMWRPAAHNMDWYEYRVYDGPVVRVDDLLGMFEEKMGVRPHNRGGRPKRDPLELPGIVGAFNRVYTNLDVLIREYDLPYEAAGEHRWKLAGSLSPAGMGPIPGADNLWFSNHAQDEAYGAAWSAFDLARIHQFGDQDTDPDQRLERKPSYKAMLELAQQDAAVIAEMARGAMSDFDTVSEEDRSWLMSLARSAKDASLADTPGNWRLLLEHDPVLRSVATHELTLEVVFTTPPPWSTDEMREQELRPLAEGDYVHLRWYLVETYKATTLNRTGVEELVASAALSHTINPLTDRLLSLKWDGIPRVETCLPGVPDSPYARMTARKCLVAAVARALDPGCKWDHMLVLHGAGGLGKTRWIEAMAYGLVGHLGSVESKDTLIAMQRSWIMVSDEGAVLKKSEDEALKEFVTRTVDVFRAPYARQAVTRPRRCVIWGTTNDDVILSRQDGNRRFLIVRCEGRVGDIEPDWVDQVWAEAVHLYRGGEQLWLTPEEMDLVHSHQSEHTEEGPSEGIVREWLETPRPEEWNEMDPEDREIAAMDRDGEPVESTCTMLLWREALHRVEHPRRGDLLSLNAALRAIGWEQSGRMARFGGYGYQREYVRCSGSG